MSILRNAYNSTTNQLRNFGNYLRDNGRELAGEAVASVMLGALALGASGVMSEQIKAGQTAQESSIPGVEWLNKKLADGACATAEFIVGHEAAVDNSFCPMSPEDISRWQDQQAPVQPGEWIPMPGGKATAVN